MRSSRCAIARHSPQWSGDAYYRPGFRSRKRRLRTCRAARSRDLRSVRPSGGARFGPAESAYMARRPAGKRVRTQSDSVMLMVRDVVASYAGAIALRSANLYVESGSIAAVVGPSGAGKSALAMVIGGFLPVISGQILLWEDDITHLPLRDRTRAGVGFVPCTGELFSRLTVTQNFELAAAASPTTVGDVFEWPLALFPELRRWMSEPAERLPTALARFAMVARASM